MHIYLTGTQRILWHLPQGYLFSNCVAVQPWIEVNFLKFRKIKLHESLFFFFWSIWHDVFDIKSRLLLPHPLNPNWFVPIIVSYKTSQAEIDSSHSKNHTNVQSSRQSSASLVSVPPCYQWLTLFLCFTFPAHSVSAHSLVPVCRVLNIMKHYALCYLRSLVTNWFAQLFLIFEHHPFCVIWFSTWTLLWTT